MPVESTNGISKDIAKFAKDERTTQIPNGSSQEKLGSGNEIYSRKQKTLIRLGERIRDNEAQLKRPLTLFEKEETLKFGKTLS